jgi:hypothetical protein
MDGEISSAGVGGGDNVGGVSAGIFGYLRLKREKPFAWVKRLIRENIKEITL